MPRPSITMVFHRTSRSSRITTTAQDSDPLQESTSDPHSSPPPSDSSVEKRIRKPSQRMLEALQDDSESNNDRTATTSAGPVKGKRRPSPVPPSPSVLRSKRARAAKGETQVAEDATPEAVMDAGEFTTPDKSPRKRAKRGSEGPSTVDSQNAATSPSSKKKVKGSATRKSQPRSRTRSQFSDASTLPEEASLPSPKMEAEAMETSSAYEDPNLTSNRNSKPKMKHGSTASTDGGNIPPLDSAVEADVAPAKKSGSKTPKALKEKAKSKRKSLDAEESEFMLASVRTTDSGSIADEGTSSLNEATSLTNDRRLTARQRAKLFGAEEHLIKLEDPRAKTPPADYLEKKEERNKKRREQAAERREELKTETVQKLLHKAPAVKKGTKAEESSAKKTVKYVMNKSGTTIFYPDGAATIETMVPIRTSVPLCSLNCYKKLQSRCGSVRVK